MDELQAQIHEHAWPRSPDGHGNLSTSQSLGGHGGSHASLPSAASANMQPYPVSKARRLNLSVSSADSVPQRRKDESTLEFFHRAKQIQANSALETLQTTNSVVAAASPAASATNSPMKSQGPKYVTT
eukprot:1430195-Rhodomonas_salina.1